MKVLLNEEPLYADITQPIPLAVLVLLVKVLLVIINREECVSMTQPLSASLFIKELLEILLEELYAYKTPLQETARLLLKAGTITDSEGVLVCYHHSTMDLSCIISESTVFDVD